MVSQLCICRFVSLAFQTAPKGFSINTWHVVDVSKKGKTNKRTVSFYGSFSFHHSCSCRAKEFSEPGPWKKMELYLRHELMGRQWRGLADDPMACKSSGNGNE